MPLLVAGSTALLLCLALAGGCATAALEAERQLLRPFERPLQRLVLDTGDEGAGGRISDLRVGVSSEEPAAPAARPGLGYRIRQWLPRLGVLLMAMAIFCFLAFAALFQPPLGAWFIYLFLVPFFVWIPGWTLHPFAGWLVGGLWLIAFPLLRRWLRTPPGRRWMRRQRRWLSRFDGGEIGSAGWSLGSWRSGGSSGSTGAGGSSSFSGRGGRFGGGGASGRW